MPFPSQPHRAKLKDLFIFFIISFHKSNVNTYNKNNCYKINIRMIDNIKIWVYNNYNYILGGYLCLHFILF